MELRSLSMLVLRQSQMDALAAPQREIFLQNAAESLRQVFPDDARHADQKAVRALIEDTIERAKPYELASERELLLFLYLLFDQGPGFESRSHQTWIERTLRDGSLEPREKMDLIYARLEAAQKRGGA